MFGISELKERTDAHKVALIRVVKDAEELTQRLAVVEQQVDKMALRGTETREQVARLSKMLAEIMERQSAQERTVGLHSEHMLELDKRLTACEAEAAPPIPAFPSIRHKPAPVGAVHTSKGLPEPMEFERVGDLNTKRSNARAPWRVRFDRWCRTAAASDLAVLGKALRASDPEGVPYNPSLVHAAFAVGLCDWLRANDIESLPAARHYTQSVGNNRYKVTIPDLQNPKLEPVNFGCVDQGKRMRAERQWSRLARFVKAELDAQRGQA